MKKLIFANYCLRHHFNIAELNRKEFIATTAALSAGALLNGCKYSRNSSNSKGKKFVVVRLNGGNDGLFTVAPVKHNELQIIRPSLTKLMKKGANWDKDWILHPSLTPLLEIRENFGLKLIPNTGLPQKNTSHFKSSEIWETGFLPGEQNEKSGWIARILESKKKLVYNHFLPSISLDSNEWLFDQGYQNHGIRWSDNNALMWFSNSFNAWLDSNKEENNSIQREMNAYFRAMRAMEDLKPAQGFTGSSFGLQLSKICSLIQQNYPYEVFHAVQGGYDTHLQEGKKLHKLYSDLAANLQSLAHSLKISGDWNDTLVFVYSEFGRTADENTNGGTDHGAAGPSFLMGGVVNEMQFESLDFDLKCNLYNIGHNSYTSLQNNFKNVYAEIQKNWLS